MNSMFLQTKRLALMGTAAAAAMLPASGVQAWSYKEAAAPYAGTTIQILDEITPLQETFASWCRYLRKRPASRSNTSF